MTELDRYREEIDKLNLELIDLIKKRMDIVEKIGEYKKKQGIPVVDLAREEKIINKMRKMAKDKNLSEAMVEDLFRRIILQARKNEGEEENEDKS